MYETFHMRNMIFVACGFCIKAVMIVSSPINHYLIHSHKKRIVWKDGANRPFYALMLRTKLY